MKIHSYPKVWNLGHPNLVGLFDNGPVVVEEKIDGSQFSFRKNLDGSLEFRSKRVEVFPEDAGMFKEAVEAVQSIADKITSGWVYRCEYLRKPKHNTLAYEKLPENHLVLWDVETPRGYLRPEEKWVEAHHIGVMPVPSLGTLEPGQKPEDLVALLETTSALGGCKVEGVVLKNYAAGGEVIAGKHVCEKFKERNNKSFRERNPGSKDIKEIVTDYAQSEARWRKAIERLRDEGALENSPRDIGKLIAEIKSDVSEELEAEVKEMLWAWAKPHLVRGSTRGFPEFYKSQLMESQFNASV